MDIWKDVKLYLGVILLLCPLSVWADGPITKANCDIAWAAPLTNVDGSPAIVDGYRLYWGSTAGDRTNSFDAGNVLITTCDTAGVQAGQQYMVVRAYNSGGESGDSNEFPFIKPLSVPDVPTGLTVQ